MNDQFAPVLYILNKMVYRFIFLSNCKIQDGKATPRGWAEESLYKEGPGSRQKQSMLLCTVHCAYFMFS